MEQSRLKSTVQNIKGLEAISQQLHLSEPLQTEHFQAMVGYAQQYLSSIEDVPAYQPAPTDGILEQVGAISETGTPINDLLTLLGEQVDTVGISTTSGRFIGYIPGGAVPHAAIGDFLASITNRYAGFYHASPGAATIENLLLRWMGEVLDYPETASGYLASGGSIANLTAVVTARDAHGISGAKISKAVVYLTEHVHHCIDKALHIAGLSGCVRRTVAVDEFYRMDADALAEQIETDKTAGLHPFMVIASAGTTNTGSVDPLETIGQIAETHALWYHIDGAYGGLFKLCPEGAEVLTGTSYSDSIVVDPHKTLFLPYGTGAVLVKDARKQFEAFNAHADYMDIADDMISSSDLSPELTKHFRGLRLWIPLKVFGTDVFRATLSEKIHLARYFHQQMSEIAGFEVGHAPDLSVVTYRYLPERGDADAFNQRLMQAIIAEGQAYLSSTRLDGKLVLRAAILSFRTHLDDVDLILDRLRFHAEQLSQT